MQKKIQNLKQFKIQLSQIMNRYENKNASKTIAVDHGSLQNHKTAPFTPFSITSGSKKDRDKNMKKYCKMMGVSQGPTTIDSSQNGKKLLADEVFFSQLNSINQYKTKIVSRHQRMLSTTIHRDEKYERMHTINSQNPFQARHSTKTQGGAVLSEDQMQKIMRISSKFTSQNEEITRQTNDHPNILKEQPIMAIPSLKDELGETQKTSMLKGQSRQLRDKFKTLDHNELPKIQTPALSSDLREGFSVQPGSQMDSDPHKVEGLRPGSDQIQVVTCPSIDIDGELKNGAQSIKTLDHNRTGQFGAKSFVLASDLQIDHNENPHQPSSGLQSKFQRVPTFQAIKANPSGEIESSDKNQTQIRLSFDKSALFGADFRQSTTLQGSLPQSTLQQQQFKSISSKNNDKLQQIITSTQRHQIVANSTKSKQQQQSFQSNQNTNYRSVNNRFAQRNKKQGAGAPKQKSNIDLYNNKISNFNEFKKNFPQGLVDKKNSIFLPNQKDQSVGLTESVPPSVHPLGTARYAMLTENTQSDEPLLQIYQSQKDQHLKTNSIMMQQNFPQNVMHPSQFVEHFPTDHSHLLLQQMAQDQINKIQQIIQYPMGITNKSNDYNEGFVDTTGYFEQQQNIPTEFQALIDKQRQFEQNHDQRYQNVASHESGFDSSKTGVRVLSPDQRQIMRFSMGQASIESPQTDVSRSRFSKQEPIQMGLSQCDGETQSPATKTSVAYNKELKKADWYWNKDKITHLARDSNYQALTPQETEIKQISRYSQQQFGEKSRLSQEFEVTSPILRQPIQGVDIKIGDTIMNQNSNKQMSQLENLMNQSIPTTKVIEQSSKQILVHKSATSIALVTGHRVDFVRKQGPGHSAYDNSNQRIQERQQNLYLNEDEDIQTRKIGSSHNVSKNENFKLMRNIKSNITPSNNHIQLQREAQIYAQQSQFISNIRERSASERQSATHYNNQDHPSKHLTSNENENTASSVPLKMDPSQPLSHTPPRNPNLEQGTTLGDPNLMQTYDTNMRSSIMQINSTKKILNDVNLTKRTEEEESEIEASKMKDGERSHQIIKEMKKIEEQFANQSIDYDPVKAQECSKERNHKRFRGSRLVANRQKGQNFRQKRLTSAVLSFSKKAEDLKIAMMAIQQNEREINILNQGNAGFFQQKGACQNQSKNQKNEERFNSSLDVYNNKQNVVTKKSKRVVKRPSNKIRQQISQDLETKNEISNLNIGKMDTEEQVQKVISLRDLMLKESNVQSKTSLLARSQRTRKNRNPRHSAGPIRRGVIPVQKKLLQDYIPIDTSRKCHQYCGHQFQYYNVGGGGKYSSMRQSFEKSKSKSKSRYKSKSPNKNQEDEYNLQQSPESNQIRSTFRKARIDGNRISPEAFSSKSRTQSPNQQERNTDQSVKQPVAPIAQSYEQRKQLHQQRIAAQKNKKLKLFEVGSQENTSHKSPLMAQEYSKVESDDSNASPLVLKNARMKSFGTTTIKPNEINQINKDAAVSSFNQSNKKSAQQLKLDISSTKIKRQSLNINDIIQDPDSITPKNNEQGAGTPKSFTMGASRNQVISQKKSSGQIHQSQRGSRSEVGKFGILQDSNRVGQRNSVRSNQDKRESSRSQPLQVFKLQQTASGHMHPGLSGGADATRQQTSHHLKIKIGDEAESQLHTTTQIPTILAAVQSKSGSKGSMRLQNASKDCPFFLANQNQMGQNQRMFINHIVNSSHKNFMLLPVQNLVFQGQNDHEIKKIQKKYELLKYFAGQNDSVKDQWRKKLLRPLTPEIEPSMDNNDFRDFQLVSQELRQRHKSQGKFTLKSRITQVAQNTKTLADLIKGPLELDSRQRQINLANENFDKIALETKDRTLMRLAIDRKKSFQNNQKRKDQLFQENGDLAIIQVPTSQIQFGTTSMEQTMGTRHSVIIIQLGDENQDMNLGCLEAAAGPTLQGTVNEELGFDQALSQATQSGQLSPSDITKVTAKPRLGKRNSSLVSGSWILPGGMVHGNIQTQIQNVDLQDQTPHFTQTRQNEFQSNKHNGILISNGTLMAPLNQTIGPQSSDSANLMAIGNAFKPNQDTLKFDLDINTGTHSRKRGSLGAQESHKKKGFQNTGHLQVEGSLRYNNPTNKQRSQAKRSERHQSQGEKDNLDIEMVKYPSPLNLDYQSSQARQHSQKQGGAQSQKKMNDDIDIDEPIYVISNNGEEQSPPINLDSQKSPENAPDTVSNIEIEEPKQIVVLNFK